MTNPNDPIIARPRTQEETTRLFQQSTSALQADGTYILNGMPQSASNELVGGLTKREYFAMKAMEGDIAEGFFGPARAALWIEMADSLIAELNKEVQS